MPKPNEIKNTPAKFWNVILDGEENATIDIYGEIAEVHPTDWFGDPIDGNFVTPKGFAEDLKRCSGAKEITVKINSGGGDLYTGMAIYNTLKAHPANIKVIIDGLAASAASVIACAGDTVQVHAGSVLMIHSAAAGLCGYFNAAELAKVSNGLKAADSAIAAVYAEKTGKDEGTLKGMMTRETWLTGAEAVENGFADELVHYGDTDLQIAACASGKRALVCNGVTVISDFTPPENAAALGMKEIKNTLPKEEPKTMNKNSTTVDTTENKQEPITAAAPTFTEADIKSAVNAAVMAERERLAAIEEISAGVDPALVARAKFGDAENPGGMTAEAFALAAMKSAAKNGNGGFMTARAAEIQDSGANDVHAAPAPAHSTPGQVLDLNSLAAKAKSFNANR